MIFLFQMYFNSDETFSPIQYLEFDLDIVCLIFMPVSLWGQVCHCGLHIHHCPFYNSHSNVITNQTRFETRKKQVLILNPTFKNPRLWTLSGLRENWKIQKRNPERANVHHIPLEKPLNIKKSHIFILNPTLKRTLKNSWQFSGP